MRRGPARWAAGALLVVPAAVLLGACGGSPTASATASHSRSCQAVAAVLSDGPGPKEDPVGYAEAQVIPLAQVRTSGAPLHKAVQALDRADRRVVATNGSAGAVRAEKAASRHLDRICPGAAP